VADNFDSDGLKIEDVKDVKKEDKKVVADWDGKAFNERRKATVNKA